MFALFRRWEAATVLRFWPPSRRLAGAIVLAVLGLAFAASVHHVLACGED
jgi:hypothetical protein